MQQRGQYNFSGTIKKKGWHRKTNGFQGFAELRANNWPSKVDNASDGFEHLAGRLERIST